MEEKYIEVIVYSDDRELVQRYADEFVDRLGKNGIPVGTWTVRKEYTIKQKIQNIGLDIRFVIEDIKEAVGKWLKSKISSESKPPKMH